MTQGVDIRDNVATTSGDLVIEGDFATSIERRHAIRIVNSTIDVVGGSVFFQPSARAEMEIIAPSVITATRNIEIYVPTQILGSDNFHLFADSEADGQGLVDIKASSDINVDGRISVRRHQPAVHVSQARQRWRVEQSARAKKAHRWGAPYVADKRSCRGIES